MPVAFAPRGAKHDLEEGADFAPKFDADGLIVCITTEAVSGDILMVAYMNRESLALTLESGVADLCAEGVDLDPEENVLLGLTRLRKELLVRGLIRERALLGLLELCLDLCVTKAPVTD